jgi:hypothetical protein
MSYSIMEMNLLVSDLLLIHAHALHLVDLSFPSVYGVHPSLTLKAAVVQASDVQDGALPDVSGAGVCH